MVRIFASVFSRNGLRLRPTPARKAPVIAASPPTTSAAQANSSTLEKTSAARPSLMGWRSTQRISGGRTSHPATPASTRKIESRTITRISSTTAAPSMASPSRERSTPSSSSVWAEIETLVAVRMIPTKTASSPLWPKGTATNAPSQDARQRRNPAGASHLFQVDLHPGDEHHQYRAQLGQVQNGLLQGEGVERTKMQKVDEGRSQDQAGQEFPEDRRLVQSSADPAAGFGRQDDDRQDQRELKERAHRWPPQAGLHSAERTQPCRQASMVAGRTLGQGRAVWSVILAQTLLPSLSAQFPRPAPPKLPPLLQRRRSRRRRIVRASPLGPGPPSAPATPGPPLLPNATSLPAGRDSGTAGRRPRRPETGTTVGGRARHSVGPGPLRSPGDRPGARRGRGAASPGSCATGYPTARRPPCGSRSGPALRQATG